MRRTGRYSYCINAHLEPQIVYTSCNRIVQWYRTEQFFIAVVDDQLVEIIVPRRPTTGPPKLSQNSQIRKRKFRMLPRVHPGPRMPTNHVGPYAWSLKYLLRPLLSTAKPPCSKRRETCALKPPIQKSHPPELAHNAW